MKQPFINYGKYQKMEFLELWQLIYLLLNKEPDWSHLKKKRESYGSNENSNFWKEFNEIKDVAKTSIICGTLEYISYHSDILYCKLNPNTFLTWAQKKEFKIPEQFIRSFDKKPQDQTKTKINNKHEENGKLSGKVRAEEAAKKWEKIKLELLQIAKEYQPPRTANKIATIAAIRKIITKTQISNTAKNMREDEDFFLLLK